MLEIYFFNYKKLQGFLREVKIIKKNQIIYL
jgi:hypothetical protein